jgi:hypothetical protein
MKTSSKIPPALFIISLFAGCTHIQPPIVTDTARELSATWQAEKIASIPGFHVPECVLPNETTGVSYVSNIESGPDGYWLDDNKGYLSTVGVDHKVVAQRWVNSLPRNAIHSPKGMCLIGNVLYFTDNTRLMCCNATTGKGVKVVVDGFTKANDLVAHGKNVWVSDTAEGAVYCVTPDGKKRAVPTPEAVNGIAFDGDKLFAVSWGLHEIYELDPTGKKEPQAFGLADNFTNLDGIEVLEDGSFLVSDFMGNKVCTIDPDRKTVRTLIELESPADIGLNRKQGLLYIPQFMIDTVAVYRIMK